MPAASEYAQHWLLEPETVFLNHGSFGACPRPVLKAQQRLREQLERQPMRFFVREWEALLDEARQGLAAFVGADEADLVFVPNATTGINAVLRSLEWEPGYELLVLDHCYPACRNALKYIAQRWGARVEVVDVPFPLTDPGRVVEAVLRRVTPRTRLAVLDHVASPSGMVFPIKEMVKALLEKGVETLVDGAHAPGMLPLDIRDLGAAYYTGNCHKWVCAPKGVGFVHARPDCAGNIHPLRISLGYESKKSERPRLWREFDWSGTEDPTPAMCVPEAISFMGSLLPGGWDELRTRNRSLALEGRDVLLSALGLEPPCPRSMVGSMASVLLPGPAGPLTALGLDPLQEALYSEYNIEVPVVPWPALSGRLLRISAQIYNTRAQYELLAEALKKLLG